MKHCLASKFEYVALFYLTHLAGLISNLKSASPAMHRVYLAMKEWSPDDITAEDVAIASGNTVLDPAAMTEWLSKYKMTTTTIETAFKKQLDAAAGPWEQERFEDFLARWIVAMDQPFFTVDDPEFREFLIYTHHPSPSLSIPRRDVVKGRIMRMCEDTIKATKQMFQVRFISLAFVFSTLQLCLQLCCSTM